MIISSLLTYEKYYYDDSDVNDEIDNIWCGVHTVDNNYSSSLNFLQVGAKPSNLSLAFYKIIITNINYYKILFLQNIIFYKI